MKYISLNIIHFAWFYSATLLFPFFTIWINNFNAQTIFGCMVYYLYGKSPIFWNQLCFLSRCPLPLSEVVTEQVIRLGMIIRAQYFKLLVFVRLNYKFSASVDRSQYTKGMSFRLSIASLVTSPIGADSPPFFLAFNKRSSCWSWHNGFTYQGLGLLKADILSPNFSV